MFSDPGCVERASPRFVLAFVTALSWGASSFGQTETGLPVFVGQPGVDPPRFEGRTDATTFAQWWYIHHETALDLRRTVTSGVDAKHGFRRVLESDYDRVMIALEAAQSDANPTVRAAAALALAKSQDRRGVACLLAEPANGVPAPLFDSNLDVRRASILGLGVGADAAVLDTLREILLSEKWEPELRATAAIAIGLIEVPVETGAEVQPLPPDAGAGLEFATIGELASGAAIDVTRIALDPSGERVIFGRADGSLAIWTVKSSKSGKTFKSHTGAITGLAFLRDDDRVASVAADGVLRIDSLRLGKAVVEVGDVGEASCLALDGTGDRIAIGARDGAITVAPTTGKKEFVKKWSLGYPVEAIAFAGDGRIVAAGDGGRVVRLGASEADGVESLATLGESTTALSIDGGGNLVLIGSESGMVRCLALSDGGSAVWARDVGSRVIDVVAPQNADFVVVSTATGSLQFLAVSTGESLGAIDAGATRFAIAADGSRVVGVAGDGSAICRDVKRVVPAATPAPGGGAPIRDPALSSRRATVLSERLQESAFYALDPLVRDGVALGAGLTGDPSLAPALERLLDVGEKKGVAGSTLGYLAISYGKLIAAGGGDVDRLFKLATKADSADVRRGAVIGLGAALSGAKGKAVDSIVHGLIQRHKLSSGEADRRVKNAISLALGRIGGPKAESFLISEFDERDDRPTIGRAPGKFGLHELDAAPLEAIALATMKSASGYELSRRRYGKEGAIHFRGALAVALGLHGPGAQKANKELTADLRKEKTPVLVAHLALGLGLARANGAADTLEARFLDPKCDASILPQLIVARAMLDVPGAAATPELVVKKLSSAKSGVERAASAFALGLIGDHRSVDPLLDMLHDKNAPAEVRAAVVAALGEFLDPGPFRRLPGALADLDGIEDPRIIAIFAGP